MQQGTKVQTSEDERGEIFGVFLQIQWKGMKEEIRERGVQGRHVIEALERTTKRE